jgi:hypothetical protein
VVFLSSPVGGFMLKPPSGPATRPLLTSGTVPAASGLAHQRPVGARRTANGMPTDTIAGVADFSWFVNYILGV